MRVVVDARVMSCRPSGIGMYLYDFLRELAAREAFEITLATDVIASPQLASFKEAGKSVVCYGRRISRSPKVLAYFSFVRKLLLEKQPDIFWEPNAVFPLRLRGYRGHTIITVHDIFPITHPECYSWLYRLYFRFGLGRTLRQADGILFVSEESRKQTQRFFQIPKKVFVSSLFVRRPPIREIRDDGYFLYIGNLEYRKGTDILLMAYRVYRELGGKKTLYIGGAIRDKQMETLLKQAQANCDGITYLNYVGEEEKYDLLSRCSCFLFPSRAEGFGIPPLEAAGYYKPIITSDLSIFKETLQIPTRTFPLGGGAEKEAHQLAIQMRQLDEDAVITFPEKKGRQQYDAALDSCRADILGEELFRFLSSL